MHKRSHRTDERKSGPDKGHVADTPSSATPAGPKGDVLALQRRAGNQAVDRLLESGSTGEPLEGSARALMEGRLGHDLGDVRVHTGSDAAQAARSIEARAFTTGQDVVFDAGQYAPGTPAGDRLLAHELTHVVQQREATSQSSGINTPGDAFEQAASGRERITPGGAVPAVQRQPAKEGTMATRLEVQEALTDYLLRVLEEQGGQTLHVTPQIKQTVQLLFQGNLDGMLAIETWLGSTALPASPAEFAREVAKRLPATVPSERLARLGKAPAKEAKDTRPQSAGDAAGAGVVDSTVAPIVKKLPIPKDWQDTIISGARSAVADGLVAVLDSAMDGSPLDGKTKASIHSAVEGLIKQKGSQPMDRQQGGAGSPSSQALPPSIVAPLPSVKGETIIKSPTIKWDFPGAATTPKQAAPLPAANPIVEAAINAVDKDALIPAELRGTPQAGEYANATEFARDIARRLDAAQKRNDYSITIELGANYAQAKDRRAIYDALQAIVYQIRDALPHHAAAVMRVTVNIGGKPGYGFPLHPGSQ